MLPKASVSARPSRLGRRGLLVTVVAVLVASCASAPASRSGSGAGVLPVGVASVEITPAEPVRLTGYGNRTAPATVVGQKLWAKALAFGADAQRPAVLIAVDLVGVSRQVTDEVASRLTKAGIERSQVAISATHTHTGPSLSGVLPFIFSVPATAGEQAAIDRYTTQLVDKLEQVAVAALADRRPARLAWGLGRAGFAANRRVLKDGKWTGFGIEPRGVVDHDLPILTVRGENDALRAILVSYACHATTFEGRDNFFHGDWPGTAKALIQARHPDAVALVTIGTGADANPNPRGGGIADVERHAQGIAAEVDRVIATRMTPVTSPPSGHFQYIDLAFSRVPSRQDWEQLSSRKDPRGFQARAMLERLDHGEPVPATVPYPVQTWTFGRELTMVFLGGEVVADYGLRLKRELNRSHLWVNAYSNDVAFYVASRRMIPEGGYEVDQSMVYYGQPGPLAEGTEDQIIRAVRASIRRE